MRPETEIQALDSLLSFEVPRIRDDVHFWMIRTQGGHFYKEFLSEGYIAFGWNLIDKRTDLKDEQLINSINIQYNKDRGRVAINKCNTFMNIINTNDIVLIPGKGLNEVAIAIIGEYYEDDSKSIDEELAALWKIKYKDSLLEDIKCPYKKRRNITVLRIVDGSELNPHLYRTLRNYSGIDDIDEHSSIILSLLFDAFIFENDLHISLKVKQELDIGLDELSGVLYGTSRYFSHFAKKENITAKVNVCSKGEIIVIVKNSLELINQYGPTFVAGFLALFGGTYGIIKIKEVPEFLKQIFTLKEVCKQEKVTTEIKEQELREKKLKNDLLEMEVSERRRIVYDKLSSQSIDGLPTEFEQQLIAGASAPLQITRCGINEDGEKAILAVLTQNEQEDKSEE